MGEMSAAYKAKRGQIVLGDSLEYMASLKPGSVDLTSPPFGLVRKNYYGNVAANGKNPIVVPCDLSNALIQFPVLIERGSDLCPASVRNPVQYTRV
jgi:hypothetical protein